MDSKWGSVALIPKGMQATVAVKVKTRIIRSDQSLPPTIRFVTGMKVIG